MIDLPRVNPVGLSETPRDFAEASRGHSLATRLLAIVLLVAFAIVAVGASAASLATWCLTSHAGIPFPFAN